MNLFGFNISISRPQLSNTPSLQLYFDALDPDPSRGRTRPSSLSASGGEGRGEVASSRITHHASRKLSRILMPDPANFHHIIEDNQLVGWRYSGFGPNTPLASQVF